MGLRWFLLRRLAFAVVALYLVLSVMFVAVAATMDPPQQFGDTPDDPLPGSPRDGSTPITERYVNWLVGVTTLDWGTYEERPITAVLADKVALTASYVVPGLLVAYAGGVALGLHAATRRGGLLDRAERVLATVGVGIPAFVLGAVLLYVMIFELGWLHPYYEEDRPIASVYNVQRLAIPAAVVGLYGLGVQFRHARTAALPVLEESFIKQVRAKGGDTRTVLRHVLRNAAAPLSSAFLSELLGLLLLSIIVLELVFRIPGFGQFLLLAAVEREPTQVIGAAIVTVAVGLAGSVGQDLLQYAIDPRVGEDEETSAQP